MWAPRSYWINPRSLSFEEENEQSTTSIRYILLMPCSGDYLHCTWLHASSKPTVKWTNDDRNGPKTLFSIHVLVYVLVFRPNSNAPFESEMPNCVVPDNDKVYLSSETEDLPCFCFVIFPMDVELSKWTSNKRNAVKVSKELSVLLFLRATVKKQ